MSETTTATNRDAILNQCWQALDELYTLNVGQALTLEIIAGDAYDDAEALGDLHKQILAALTATREAKRPQNEVQQALAEICPQEWGEAA
jgi:hypothetical protein